MFNVRGPERLHSAFGVTSPWVFPSDKTMKASKLFLLLTAAVAIASLPLVASMLPEDTIGTSDWAQWNKKEKLIFLTGFRLGTGPIVNSAPSTSENALALSKDEYEEVVKRMDSFYADKANKDVTIRGAIEIVLMQMRHAPETALAKKLEMERIRKRWGF